jgi:predicted enzyme related to lactoylglutathione lyase
VRRVFSAPEEVTMAAKKSAKKTAKKGAGKTARKSASKAAKKKAATFEVVHWEIQAKNPGKLHKFYAGALGWKIDANNPMQYGMVGSGGRHGIDGGIGGQPGGNTPSRVLVYASVPKIPPVLKKIESLGGKTIMPRTDIGPVIMALYEDPEGNTMGLIEG